MLRMLCGLLVCCVSMNAANAAEPLDVVKKAIEANGGKKALTKYDAAVLTGKGTVMTQGMKLEYSATWSFHYPDKLRVDIETDVMGMPFKIAQIYNGKDGWSKIGDMVMKMTDDQKKALAMQMKVDVASTFVPLLEKKKYTVSSLGEEKVKGKPAIGLNVTGKDGLDVNLYLDAKSYLLVKQVYQTKSEDGKDVTQTVYPTAYKKVKGVPFPMKLTIQQEGKTFVTAEFSEVEFKDKLDAKLFSKPK